MREKLVSRAERILERAGYRVLKYFSACFDLAASGRKRLLVKAILNVDGFRPGHARDLKKLAVCVDAEPIVVGVKTKRGLLKKGVVYERFGVIALSPETLEGYVAGECPLPFYSRGRELVEFDPVRLRRLRESRGLSLSGMAALLGVSKEAVYLYERGSLKMRREIAERIENEFGESITKKVELRISAPEEGLEKRLSTALASLDFRVREFERTGFDVFAYDESNRVLMTEGIPSSPEKIMSLSDFFDSKVGFVSEHGEEDLPVLSWEELSSAGSKKKLLSLLR